MALSVPIDKTNSPASRTFCNRFFIVLPPFEFSLQSSFPMHCVDFGGDLTDDLALEMSLLAGSLMCRHTSRKAKRSGSLAHDKALAAFDWSLIRRADEVMPFPPRLRLFLNISSLQLRSS